MANSISKSPKALGTENVRSLLMTYSVPAIVAMIASSLYNVIDRIFIGQGVGELALAGLAITFPLMNLSIAFGAMIGAGGSTLVSIKMGQDDNEGATKVLGNVVMLNIIIGLVYMLGVLLFLDPILRLFGASDDTLQYARAFMIPILLGNVITHLYFGLNNVMRSSGYPQKARNATLLTVLVNLVLAPLFIFVMKWGITGAALATILAQSVSFVFVLRHFSKADSYIRFKKGIFTLDKNIVKGILSIGMSPFVINACGCLVVIVINLMLRKFSGDMAISAYGIINSVMMLFFMLILGLAQGMQPIAGFNFGAKQYDRVISVFKYTALYSTIVMSISFLICELLPEYIAMMFTDNEELIGISSRGMRIMMMAAPTVGFGMVVGNFFQSIGKAGKAIFLSSTRQMLFLIPLLFALPPFFQLDGVWLSVPIADVLAFITAALMFYKQYKEFKKKIEDKSVTTEN